MARKRPDPADFRFTNKTGEVLTREPGQVYPYDFALDTLEDCTVYLLDTIAQVTGDKCKNCRLHFGPTEGPIFLRDCENCVITAVCGQFRLKNCTNLKIYLYCSSDPSIEYSSNLMFGPYNFSYPLQDQHFKKAKLEPNKNLWSQVFDFNKAEGEIHWRLMQPSEFEELNWEKADLGEPINPSPRSVAYGGELEEEITVGSQPKEVDGLMSFGINVAQGEAEQVLQGMIGGQGQQIPENYNAFEDEEQEDFFGNQSDPFTSGSPQKQYGSSDPFGGTAAQDPFGGPAAQDPFGGPAQDPFGGPAQDPFGQPQTTFGQPLTAQDPSVQPQTPLQSDEDPEEADRNRKREAENQERSKRLYQKDEKERRIRDERRAKAREDLRAWYNNRAKMTAQKKEMNIEEENFKKQQKTEASPWKKTATMIDFREDRKEVTKMKSVLLSKKNES